MSEATLDRRLSVKKRLRQLAKCPKAPFDMNELVRMLFQVKTDKSVHLPEDSPPDFLTVVFLAMASRKNLPDLSTVRFACRLVRQNKELCYCEPLLQAIANADNLAVELKRIAAWIRKKKDSRKLATVESTVYKKSIQQYLGGIRFPLKAPLIDFSDLEKGSFAARTNGKRIFLPYRVDVSEDPENGRLINESVLFYLAFHELQHWGILGARSSFEFDFRTSEGTRLLKKIKPILELLEHHQLHLRRRTLYWQLLQEEGIAHEDEAPQLTHIEVVAICSKSTKLFHWFYNGFEDIRIHRQSIEAGVGELQEITNRLQFRLQPHPAFQTPFARFSAHVVNLVTGQDSSQLPVPAEFAETLSRIREWTQNCHSRPSKLLSPETSATYAFQAVQLVFRQHGKSNKTRQALNAEIDRIVSEVSLEELMMRWLLSGRKAVDSEYRKGKGHLPPKREKIVDGKKFDEFSIVTERIEKDVVTVDDSVFKPTRKPLPAYQLPGFRGLRNHRQCGQLRESDEYTLDQSGDELAMEIIPESIAKFRATGERTGRHFWNRMQQGSKDRISLLIDLSASMEQYRSGLAGTPMQMAIAATKQIHEQSSRYGMEVETWGIIDGGRQPVSLLQIRPEQVNQIHAKGVGGARFGAGIRFLIRRHRNLSGRQIIICLTDGSGVYANEGHDELFRRVRKSNCQTCQLVGPGRRGCSVEKPDRVGTGDEQYLFRNAEYQYADIGHAIDTAPPNTEIRYVEFNSDPLNKIMNRFLSQQWTACAGALDLASN